MEKLNFAKIIANFLIKIGAFGYNFKEPIPWASGTFNPAYVDNRKLQSDLIARTTLRKGLASLIKSHEIRRIDWVYAIPTAGIAPATLLCLELDKPMLIKLNGEYYEVDIHGAKCFAEGSVTSLMESADVFAGTVPMGIIFGIMLAEEAKKPFLLVRPKPKDHGLRQQIEGIQEKDKSVVLIDPQYEHGSYYTEDATQALEDGGFDVLPKPWALQVQHFIKPVPTDDIVGKIIIGVEDLISTGESSLKELENLMGHGANIIPVSIFNYLLKSSEENFAAKGLQVRSVISFVDLIEELNSMLWQWHIDQPNWGDKNGFPSKK